MADDIRRFPCPKCGADLAFAPDVAQLQCGYCGWEDTTPPANPGKVQERAYDRYFQTQATQLVTLSNTSLSVDCDNCGANITFEPPKTAGQCPFCAAAIVAQGHSPDPVLAPEGLVPFAVGRRDAQNHIKKWLSKLWFAPNALKKLAQPEKIQGVYLPFWTYDAQTKSRYRGEHATYYYTTETYTDTDSDGKSVQKTREVRHTRWRSAQGNVSRFFDDVLIPGTTLVERRRLDALQPWGFPDSVKAYDASYLAGFEAQRAQVTLEQGFEQAQGVMAERIREDVRRDIGGDEQRIHSVSTDYSQVTFKHLLLPVWMASYRYKNKSYQVLVNALTGQVQGDHPYSVWKVTLAALAGTLTVLGVLWLMAQ